MKKIVFGLVILSTLLTLALASNSSIIFSTSFEDKGWITILNKGYYGYTQLKFNSFIPDTSLSKIDSYDGETSLVYQNKKGKHTPNVYYFDSFSEDTVYLSWNRKYEPGYLFTCEAKGNGVYATNNYKEIDAGQKPNGKDAFSCKVQLMPDGWYSMTLNKTKKWGDTSKAEPLLYCYNPEQPNGYGTKFEQNIGMTKYIKAGEWNNYEFMLKANTPGLRDGEVKLWINGELKIHYTNLRFRDTKDLKINRLDLSARVGGFCSSPKDQKVYDDGLILSREFIPLQKQNIYKNLSPKSDFELPKGSFYTNITQKFKNTTSDIPTSYQWDFNNDGIIDSTQKDGEYIYTNSGIYDIKLLTKNTYGQSIIYKQLEIYKNPNSSITNPSTPINTNSGSSSQGKSSSGNTQMTSSSTLDNTGGIINTNSGTTLFLGRNYGIASKTKSQQKTFGDSRVEFYTIDFDGDKVYRDNCPYLGNPSQIDTNDNGIGDECE